METKDIVIEVFVNDSYFTTWGVFDSIQDAKDYAYTNISNGWICKIFEGEKLRVVVECNSDRVTFQV